MTRLKSKIKVEIKLLKSMGLNNIIHITHGNKENNKDLKVAIEPT